MGGTAPGSGEQAEPPPSISVAVPAAAPKSRVKIKEFATSRKRIRNRGKKLTSTIIEFKLSRATLLVFVFRGPGPSCDVAARIPAVGLAGLNRFRFYGYIGQRPLDAGTYLMVLRPEGSSRQLARSHISILNPAAPRTKQVRPDCRQDKPVDLTAVLAAAPLLGSLVGDFDSAPEPSSAPAAVAEKTTKPKPNPQTGGALGEEAEESAGLPLPPGTDRSGDDSTSLVELLAGPALLALLMAALSVFVTRRRRSAQRTW